MSTEGFWGFLSKREWLTLATGYVGSDVVGLEVNSPSGGDVEASISNGHFAAWWPSAVPSGENDGWAGPVTYTVTLADGTTRTFTQ